MPATKAPPTILKLDVLPDTSLTPFRTDEAMLADAPSDAADLIKWPRAPELWEFEKMASLITPAAYFTRGELIDTSSAARTHLYEALADGRPGWAPLMRQMLGAKAPPTEVEAKKGLLYREVDMFAATKSNKMIQGVGELLRPRQDGGAPPRTRLLPRRNGKGRRFFARS